MKRHGRCTVQKSIGCALALIRDTFLPIESSFCSHRNAAADAGGAEERPTEEEWSDVDDDDKEEDDEDKS